MARVVVIGGGLAGSGSAVRLAKLGHDVTLLEARSGVGGAVGHVEQDGFRWDAGPAATALPAVLRDLFRKSGRPLERELGLVPVEPLREHRFLDGTAVPLPSGSRGAQLAAVSAALGTASGVSWVDYVHSFADTWDLLRRDLLERPHDPALLSDRSRALLRSRHRLTRVTRQRLPDRRLRRIATYHAVTAGHDPGKVPAWWGMLDYVEQNFGTWTFPGGLGSLAGLLAKRLRERRVTVLTGTRARDLELGPSGPVAVHSDSGPIPADLVVVAVDPRGLPALVRYAGRTTPTTPPTVIHLGLRADPPLLSRVGEPSSTTAGTPAATDPRAGVPQELVLHEDGGLVVVRREATAPAERAAWTLQIRGRVSDDPLRLLARRGLDVRDLVATRLDRAPASFAVGPGSPYGFSWRGRSTLARRPGPASPVPGVFLAGAATGGGGWLPFVGLTAAVVADLVGPPDRPGHAPD